MMISPRKNLNLFYTALVHHTTTNVLVEIIMLNLARIGLALLLCISFHTVWAADAVADWRKAAGVEWDILFRGVTPNLPWAASTTY